MYISIIVEMHSSASTQSISTKYKNQNLEIQSVFLPQLKMILNPCKSVKSVLSVGNLILNTLCRRTAVRLYDIDAEKIGKLLYL